MNMEMYNNAPHLPDFILIFQEFLLQIFLTFYRYISVFV